jgi:hypothetical protein
MFKSKHPAARQQLSQLLTESMPAAEARTPVKNTMCSARYRPGAIPGAGSLHRSASPSVIPSAERQPDSFQVLQLVAK